MRKLALILGGVACVHFAISQEVSKIKYHELEKIIQASESQLTIVNFWATWCAPCIKELPHFEAADEMSDIKVLLVSLDFPQDYEKVQKFVIKKQLQPWGWHSGLSGMVFQSA